MRQLFVYQKEGNNLAKRYDNRHRLLRTGERQRVSGTYEYRWTTRNGTSRSVSAPTLEELRKKEEQVMKDKSDGIKADAQNVKLDDIFDLWSYLKRGLKDNTFQNYKYMYTMFVSPKLGQLRLCTLKRSDIKRFYNYLLEERGLKLSTIDSVHTVLHQVLGLAVEENYLRVNIADNLLKELKQSHNIKSEHRRALTVSEQNLFMDFLKLENTPYHHWYPIFKVMIDTGMRVGEITGLRWSDIDLEEGMIHVNHTLVYYNHAENGCYFNVHNTKTKAGTRTIPMIAEVKEAFLIEKAFQELNELTCQSVIDGYTDFIFINRFGKVQHQGTLNKALRRIIRDCNDRQLNKGEKDPVLLPSFSCHSLRHNFTKRLVEAGVNKKVEQEVLGNADFSTKKDIYTDVTKELKQREFDELEKKLKIQRQTEDGEGD